MKIEKLETFVAVKLDDGAHHYRQRNPRRRRVDILRMARSRQRCRTIIRTVSDRTGPATQRAPLELHVPCENRCAEVRSEAGISAIDQANCGTSKASISRSPGLAVARRQGAGCRACDAGCFRRERSKKSRMLPPPRESRRVSPLSSACYTSMITRRCATVNASKTS